MNKVMEAEEETVAAAGRKRKRAKKSEGEGEDGEGEEEGEEGEEQGGERGPLPDGTIPGTEVWPLDRLVAGLTSMTIYTHYNMPDLKQFCRLHGINPAGRKTILIKRIVAFLNAGTAPEP